MDIHGKIQGASGFISSKSIVYNICVYIIFIYCIYTYIYTFICIYIKENKSMKRIPFSCFFYQTESVF